VSNTKGSAKRSLLDEVSPAAIDIDVPDIVHATESHRTNNDDHQQTDYDYHHLKEIVPHRRFHATLYK